MLLQSANKLDFSDWFVDSAILYHQNGSIPTNLSENQKSNEIYEIVRRFHLNDPSKKKKYRVKMVVDENGNQVDEVVGRLFYRQDLLKIV